MISGAANDDPSCIVTYAIAGAALGYATLWTSLVLFPLLAAVQLICSRLGMISGRGMSGALRVSYSRWLLLPVCGLLAIANVVQIGADLGGMAEVTEMVTGAPRLPVAVMYAAGILGLLVLFSYTRMVQIFKWLTLVLFAYVAAALIASPEWSAVAAATFVPRVELSATSVAMLVAIVGATFSPYFLFWQAESEVEQEYCFGRRSVAQRQGASRAEIERSKVDVLAGAFISKVITYFITLTTAAALFGTGRRIQSARDAASALQPVAGPAASWLFAIGVVGTGLLAIPALAGSCAYAISEAVRWRASLEENPRSVPYFYAVLTVALLVGLGLLFLRLNPVRMLFWSSVLNGVLAPASMLLAVLLAGNRKVMGPQVAPPPIRWLGWASVALSSAAAGGMLVTLR